MWLDITVLQFIGMQGVSQKKKHYILPSIVLRALYSCIVNHMQICIRSVDVFIFIMSVQLVKEKFKELLEE
jgi:predicted cation transporter